MRIESEEASAHPALIIERLKLQAHLRPYDKAQ
jgi:hypothetical protein